MDLNRGNYLNVYVQSVQQGKRIRLVTLDGQMIESGLFVSCSRKERSLIPVGAILRLECRKVKSRNSKSYLRLSKSTQLTQLSLFDNAVQTAIQLSFL